MTPVPDEIAREIDRLRRGVTELERQVEEFPPGAFLEALGEWSPRDIVVHLIGWTRYVVTGAEQVRHGELPFYDIDPGEDYSNVNAQLVLANPARDPATLLRELHDAEEELIDYLRGVELDDWGRDFGVRHRGEPVTVGGTIAELIDDFEHHSRQLAAHAQR